MISETPRTYNSTNVIEGSRRGAIRLQYKDEEFTRGTSCGRWLPT